MNRTYNEIVEHKGMYLNLGYTWDLLHDFGSTNLSKIMFGVEYLKSEISTILSDNLDASKQPLS
jgi:hypothetical protein